MREAGCRLMGWSLMVLMVSAVLPVAAAQSPTVGLGLDQGRVREMQADGGVPAYGSYWVGSWTAQHGWSGLDNALDGARAAGVTPVVYWYYWGDSITPSCVENGCDGRSKAQWDNMTQTLMQRIQAKMGGRETLVVLENEFNKGGITDEWYAPTFDGYLAQKARELHTVPGVKVVLGFGAWGESAWGRFPKALAECDMVGFQMMRGSTRDSEATYRGAPDKIASVLAHIKSINGKAAFLYDLALSSYPDAHWTEVQGATLTSILARRAEYASNGLVGIVYRELRDNPGMSPANYFGYAEQHWGLKLNDGTPKPAYAAWRDATRPAASSVPGSFEAEAMLASTGGRFADASASGGAFWNVWANGSLSQHVASQGGAHRVTILAKGDALHGVDPRMELRVGGAAVAAWSVAPGAWAPYAANVTLPAGETTLSVAFTNDQRDASGDRNLHVDLVRVELPPQNQPPAATFAVSADGLSVSVDASGSSDPEGQPLAYAWDFGDGASATGVRASHAYAASGTYTVRLVVSDGASTATATRELSVQRPNAAPSAAFAVRGADLAWSFDASASTDADGDALAYAWDMGDGTALAGARVDHAYAAPGAYDVVLTVSDGAASSSATRTVTATQPNRAPVASFAVEGADLAWRFDAAGSSDADGDALAYAWSFGDGATATGATAAHTYAAAGSYAVTLTVSDGKASHAQTRTVLATRPNAAPTAAFHVSGADLSWSFDASGSADADGDALAYAWDMGDGTTLAGVRVSHRYLAAGSYAVTLRVSDGKADATSTRTVAATAPNRAPVAGFTVAGAALAWSFDASGSTDADGDALAYRWNFGDGSSATGVTASKTYAAAGSYTVTLTVADGRGGTAHASKAVNATAPPAFRDRQAEDFLRKDNGAAFDDASAEGGRAWLLWSNGAIRQGFQPGAGQWQVEIRAKGDPAAGAAPVMELHADGVVVARWNVTATTWATYAAPVGFAPDQARTISVHFTNDYYGSLGDRNLRVDAVRLAPPTVLREAEDFGHKANGAAYSDGAASGGRAWLLWSNGAMRDTLAPQPGSYMVEVVAKGDYARGWPIMELRADGNLVGRWTVGTSTWQTYRASAPVDFGTAKTLSVHFVNDWKSGSEDRNLRVDAVRLVPSPS